MIYNSLSYCKLGDECVCVCFSFKTTPSFQDSLTPFYLFIYSSVIYSFRISFVVGYLPSRHSRNYFF